MKKIEHGFERMIFFSRWLLSPIYLGLVAAVFILIFKFYKELIFLFSNLTSLDESQIIVGLLSLIDISLIANLLFIVTFSSYESFVSKIDIDTDEDKPGWMGTVSFAGLKIKVLGSIVAISAIELLRMFFNISAYTETEIMWRVIIHIVIVVSGVLIALMDKASK